MPNAKKCRRSKSTRSGTRPKGSYPVPGGGYATELVGPPNRRGRRIRTVAVHRAEPHVKPIVDALLALVAEEYLDAEQLRSRQDH